MLGDIKVAPVDYLGTALGRIPLNAGVLFVGNQPTARMPRGRAHRGWLRGEVPLVNSRATTGGQQRAGGSDRKQGAADRAGVLLARAGSSVSRLCLNSESYIGIQT